jgi:putative ABC transport system ATP-binding protein
METTELRSHAAVRCRGLTKTFGEGDAAVRALRGVDLDVRRGEIFMLVGPSGSGKTTLLSVIAAMLDQDSGRCEVLGREVEQMDELARARFRRDCIGFVFQGFNLLPALSAAENVAVPLIIAGARRQRALEISRDVLDRVGLSHRADKMPAQMSGGERQRIAVGRALVHGPGLVIGDEPTSNLDHETGHRVMQLLDEVARAPDRGVIVATHDPRILPFADRMGRMEDGSIVEIVEGENVRGGP